MLRSRQPHRVCFEAFLLAEVLNYRYGANMDRKPPEPFPGQDPNANCDDLRWYCCMSVWLFSFYSLVFQMKGLYGTSRPAMLQKQCRWTQSFGMHTSTLA